MDLPVVDFNSKHFNKDFNEKFKYYNFCLIANTPLIYSNVLTNHYSLYSNFFASQEKNNFLFNKEMHDGFIPLEHSEIAKNSKIKDYKEFFHYYPWGRCPDSLAEISNKLFNELNHIAKKATASIEANLTLEIRQKHSTQLEKITIGSSKTLLRISNYPSFNQDAYEFNLPRAAEHTDINLITVQPPSNSSGLECKMPDGSWIMVDDNDFVFVGCGEMLTKYTFGAYKSCEHRVSPPSKNANHSRLSIMFFLHPRSDVILENQTANYHLKNRIKELGLF